VRQRRIGLGSAGRKAGLQLVELEFGLGATFAAVAGLGAIL
jgi:hypothetical protein